MLEIKRVIVNILTSLSISSVDLPSVTLVKLSACFLNLSKDLLSFMKYTNSYMPLVPWTFCSIGSEKIIKYGLKFIYS